MASTEKLEAPWRTVVSHREEKKEHLSLNRGLTWWVSYIQKVKLSCGHLKVYRGQNYPKTKARCEKCLNRALKKAERVDAPCS